MHVLIASPLRLTAQYGGGAAARIMARAAGLDAARRAAGLPSLRLVPEVGLPDFALPPADPGDPDALRQQLLQLADRLAANGQGLTSVLLVGGPATLPFHRLANPLDDHDGPILTDYPYGCRETSLPLLDWAVGRLPAGEGDDPRDLMRLLALAIHMHRRGARGVGRTFGYSTEAWRRASAEVYRAIADPARLLSSPPVSADTLDPGMLSGAGLVYINLHGSRAGQRWYGQAAAGRRQMVVALRPQDLAAVSLLGAVVVSECCYGAYSPESDLGDSIAMSLLRRGAACLLGATGLAYGSAGPPLLGADLLAFHFLRIAAAGATAGAALVRARELMARDTLLLQGFLDDDDQKTLAQFVLYGDPAMSTLLANSRLQRSVTTLGPVGGRGEAEPPHPNAGVGGGGGRPLPTKPLACAGRRPSRSHRWRFASRVNVARAGAETS